jgi:adenylosuccinate synthase
MGAQWGDEGKGKVIDVLAREADVVVRYQGGNNAGHTVKIGDDQYVLHLIPSGMLHPGKACVIGNGVVVDPLALLNEIGELEGRGVRVSGRLFVSDRCHAIFPYHRMLDESREKIRQAGEKLGTTKRGIGPAYSDKSARVGLRLADLVDPDFRRIAARPLEEAARVLAALGAAPLEQERILTEYEEAGKRLARYVTDTVTLLNQAVREGKNILLEGAQGTMLDIDFGTYPFVTSSNATAGGASTGTGISPAHIDRVIGVIKAYTTRVGEGPFPPDLRADVAALLGREGKEFGATTGRPRRCGWFDVVVARYAAMINGVDCWAMTKLDVLDSLETIRICVAYDCRGKRIETVPANIRDFQDCRPIYEDMPGWRCSTKEVTRYADLPAAARAYVERLCDLTGVKLGILSVGPKRSSTLRIAI